MIRSAALVGLLRRPTRRIVVGRATASLFSV